MRTTSGSSRIIRALLATLLLSSANVAAHAADSGSQAMTPADDVAKLPGIALNQKLADGLPAGIKSAGLLKVATDLTPPISFHADDGKLVGIDA
ncbi:ABC transporter substrate-binding protein, partial [Bradyrhizobium sp. Lot11]